MFYSISNHFFTLKVENCKGNCLMLTKFWIISFKNENMSQMKQNDLCSTKDTGQPWPPKTQVSLGHQRPGSALASTESVQNLPYVHEEMMSP